jgi:peptidoglycan DL-endopeptidase CwlO
VQSPSAGVSGLAVGVGAAGFLLVYSGIKNATVSDTLRALLQQQPIPTATGGSVDEVRNQVAAGIAAGAIGGATTGGLSAIISGAVAGGDSIVAEARKYLGRPYLFGASGPNKFDCSGLVNRVLSTLGMPIPGSPTGKFTGHGPVSQQYYVWSGAPVVPRELTQAGDLVCWMGHIGIASSATTMVDASGGPGKVTERRIWWTPAPLIRRVRAVQAPAGQNRSG